MTTLPQRLRQMADHTGLDAVADLLREAATDLERERESRQAAQIENEDLKARIARSGVEQQRAVLAEREACAQMCDQMEYPITAAAIRARGAAAQQPEGEPT